MKDFIKNIEALVGGIPADKALHFIAGMLVVAIVAIVVPIIANFAFPIAFAVGLAKEIIDEVRYNGFDTYDLIASVAGGMVMQVFIWVQ